MDDEHGERRAARRRRSRLARTVTSALDDKRSDLRRLLVESGLDSEVAMLRAHLVARADAAPCPSIDVPKTFESLVGTAADIRLRWWLGGVDHHVMPTAVVALARLLPTGQATVQRLLAPVFGVDRGDLPAPIERDVARAALALASAEVLARVGRAAPIRVEEMPTDDFLIWVAPAVDPLVAISSTFGSVLAPLLPATKVDPGPIVGFPGLNADADLVIDGTLIEVKCVASIRRNATTTVRQLLVYASLLEETPQAVAGLFPRQGVLSTHHIEELGDRLAALGTSIRDTYHRPRFRLARRAPQRPRPSTSTLEEPRKEN